MIGIFKLGTASVNEKTIIPINYMVKNETKFYEIFLYNFTSCMFLLITAPLLGVIPFISSVNLMYTLGKTLKLVSNSRNIELISVIKITAFHGIFELIPLLIILNISKDIFLISIKYFFDDEPISLFKQIKLYYSSKVNRVVPIIFISLLLGSVIEYFISIELINKLSILK